jgi:hypothetical protein
MHIRTLAQRAVAPVLLTLAGVASLIYGAAFHVASVTEEQEVEETIEVPSAFGPPPGFADGPGFGGPGAMGSPFAPPPVVTKVKRKIFVTADTAEPTLVWEITIGGLARLDTGELKRTYSGAAPSLCPS